MKYEYFLYTYRKSGGENMEKKHGGFILNFFVRAILGLGMIFFVNEYLDYRNIPVSVGMNGISFLTSGFLGIPGVGMLYGILFYRFL